MTSANQRRDTLLTALAMLEVDWPQRQEPEVVSSLRQWLSSWNGLGVVIVGMERQGYDLELVRDGRLGWRATFYLTGRVHSFTSSTGSSYEHARQGDPEGGA
jgi:hypothetical protein